MNSSVAVGQGFVSIWDTTKPGSTGNNQIRIPTRAGYNYNFTVDWGDGTIESGLIWGPTHTYPNAGTYTVTISGDFPAIYFNNSGDKDKIIEILDWGNIEWQDMENAFHGCSNLNFGAIDPPNLSQVTSLKETLFNQSNLVFEDQLDSTTGYISTETSDPLAKRLQQLSYIDLAASFILYNEFFLMDLSLKHLNQPNTSFDPGAINKKQLAITANFAYEFNLNPLDRGILPRHTYLLAYGSYNRQGMTNFLYLSQEFQLGEFALGVNEQLSFFNGLHISQLGFNAGLSYENFDFGIVYTFPLKNKLRTYAPRIFELYLTFDFSKFRRNRRGLYKRLQIDNYF